MSTFDKLLERIKSLDKNLRVKELIIVLESLGYTWKQPGKGSSHYIFRKPNSPKIVIPSHGTIKVIYVKKVKELLEESENEKRS